MSAELNESVQEEILDEASSQPESQQQHDAEEHQAKSKSSDEDKNWAEARRKMKRLEEQNREMQEAIEKFKQPKQEDDEDYDDLVTKGQVRQLATKIAEDIVRKQEAATVEDRLVLKHPDFEQVVSRENIEKLKETEPELALSLANIPDPYKQGIAAYKMLKKMGIYQETESSQEKQKALENSQKPRSVHTISKNSAIGNAHLFENGLTPALKKQLWDEMQSARKQA